MNNLKDAVLAQLDMEREEVPRALADVARYGADTGVSGFTYFFDTCKFARENRDLIVERLRSDVSDFGVANVPAMLKGWRTFADYSDFEIEGMWVDFLRGVENKDPTLENALAWYALESVAHDEER